MKIRKLYIVIISLISLFLLYFGLGFDEIIRGFKVFSNHIFEISEKNELYEYTYYAVDDASGNQELFFLIPAALLIILYIGIMLYFKNKPMLVVFFVAYVMFQVYFGIFFNVIVNLIATMLMLLVFTGKSSEQMTSSTYIILRFSTEI